MIFTSVEILFVQRKMYLIQLFRIYIEIFYQLIKLIIQIGNIFDLLKTTSAQSAQRSFTSYTFTLVLIFILLNLIQNVQTTSKKFECLSWTGSER